MCHFLVDFFFPLTALGGYQPQEDTTVLVTFWTVTPFTAWAMLLGHQLYLAPISSLSVSMSPRNDSESLKPKPGFKGGVQVQSSLSKLFLFYVSPLPATSHYTHNVHIHINLFLN